MVFIFNDTPGMHAVAATGTGLADETAAGGMECQAAGQAVLPPGLDPVSAANVAKIQACTTEINAHLATASGYQHVYSASITGSATAFNQTDSLNAAGLDAVGLNAARPNG